MGEIIFDVLSSEFAVKYTNKLVEKSENKKSAVMKWFLQTENEIWNWSDRIKTVQSFSFFHNLSPNLKISLKTKIKIFFAKRIKSGKYCYVEFNNN